jgi:Ca2+-binding RTX toxin-like protein
MIYVDSDSPFRQFGPALSLADPTFTRSILPSTAALRDGNHVMLWATEAKDGSGFGVFGQILAPDNTRVGAEFRINTQTEGHQTQPHVKGLPGGGFIAAWVEEGRGIVLRSFGADGIPAGPETTLGTPTVFGSHITSGSSAPSLAVQQDGSVGLVWIDRASDGSTPPQMKLAIFGADGQQRSAVIDVPTTMTQFTLPEARIRTDGDQGFAVIGYLNDNSEGMFHGWTVAANGTLLAPIQTNDTGGGLGAYSLVETPTTPSGWQSFISYDDWTTYYRTEQAIHLEGYGWMSFGYRVGPEHDGFSYTHLPGSTGIWQLGPGTRGLLDVTPIDEDSFRFTVSANLGWNVMHPVSYVIGVNRPATGQPEILGTAQRGETLRVDISGIEDRFGIRADSLEYVWFRDGARFLTTRSDTLLLDQTHMGRRLSVEVRFVDGLGFTERRRSEQTDPISAEATFGTPGADTLTGTDQMDTIFGGAGNDLIRGGAHADRLYGEDGNDTLYGDTGADLLLGGAGNDILVGGHGDDTLDGGTGNDLMDGGAGRDHLFGGDGDDTAFGGTDNDLIVTGAGNDLARGESGNDTLDGQWGMDTLYGDDGNDLLSGGIGRDRLYGGSGNDTLSGGRGNDRLFGGDGNDRLNGGSGNDLLFAGRGSDRLIGGEGADVFVWTHAGQSPATGRPDVIVDFEPGIDRIDLSALHDDLRFGPRLTGRPGDIAYDSALGRISVDLTGDGAADFLVMITPGLAFGAGDLIL